MRSQDYPATTRPEHEMLLVCCRTDLDKAHLERIRNLASNPGVKWDILYDLAHFHRTIPLVYRSLEMCSDAVPVEFLKKLKSCYRENCALNLSLLATLRKIISVLEQSRVQVVPFKGPVFTELIYGDISFRSFADLDILVAQRDIERVAKTFLQNGFRPYYDLPVEVYLKLVRRMHHANFVNVQNGAVVEVHWEISGNYVNQPVDFEFLAPRFEKALLHTQYVTTLGKEDLLIYLCIHGNRHRWAHLDAVCCIAELIRKCAEIDWDLAFSTAERLGAIRIVTLGLLLAERLLGLPVALRMKKKMIDFDNLDGIAEEVETKMFDLNDEQDPTAYHVSGVLYHLRTLDHINDGIKYGIRKFCIPDIYDLLWFPLPDYLWFLYPIVRPLRFCAMTFKKKLSGA